MLYTEIVKGVITIRFAIYSRKSKFTGKGDSVENQVEMCKDYIKMKFGDVPETDIYVFEDEGFTGKNLSRPQFKKFMEEETNNPFDYVVCYRLDRISRNIGDFANLIDSLNSRNTSFLSIKEQFDTSTPMGRAMMNIAAVFAQLERETIAERIKDNMYLLAKDGRWSGGTTPLGYKSVKKTNITGDKTRSYFVLEFDEEQLPLAKLIFQKYNELHSINGVEVYLKNHGYKTQKGSDWDYSNLKRILTNPVYCIADKASYEYFTNLGSNVCFTPKDCDGESGILPYNRFSGAKRAVQPPDKWLVTVSKHRGILTGKEWIEIQNIIKNNSKNMFGGKANTRRPISKKSLLSGILFCSCGTHMRPKNYPSGSMYYICEIKDKLGVNKCDTPNIKGDALDEIVLEELFSFNLDGNSVNSQIKSIKSKINSADEELKMQNERLSKKKKENEKSINNLVCALAMNVSTETVQAINNQISNLSKENEQIDKQIEENSQIDNSKNKMNTKLSTILDALVYLKANFNKLSIENKREYIKKIIEKVVWDGKEIHIFIKGVL